MFVSHLACRAAFTDRGSRFDWLRSGGRHGRMRKITASMEFIGVLSS
jgi:hypothetical protein